MHANIVSTGSYLPEIEVTNDALRAKFNAAAPEVRRQDGSIDRHSQPLVCAR
jgi:3-oxoacyl-[acyl-carrier-protein] synthase III